MIDTDGAGRLERIFLAGIDAESALSSLAEALDARGVDDPELRAYLGELSEKLDLIGKTAVRGSRGPCCVDTMRKAA